MSDQEPNYLTMQEAVAYLEREHGVTLNYYNLSRFNGMGVGPKFRRMGNSPMYLPDDLDAWADDRKDDDQRASA